MKLQQIGLCLLCAALLLGCEANTQAAARNADAEPAERAAASADRARCQACHQGALSLNKFPPAELAGRIAQLRGAPGDHPPLQLEHASEADIEALADALAAHSAL